MIKPAVLLQNIPAGLRDPLIEEFQGIVRAHYEGKWKAAGIDAGRFCEVVYTILEGQLSGQFPASPSKPTRFPEACKALESKPPVQVGDRSLRVLIPRVLPGMYDIRNNRNIGHVGGDVVSNKMDASYLRNAATWIMGELIRVFHQTTTDEAQASVDALADLEHPLVWELDGVRRVLDVTLSAPERALVLLNSVVGWCSVTDLQSWAKGDKKFRNNVMVRLAEKLEVEYQPNADRAIITPIGAKRVAQILKKK